MDVVNATQADLDQILDWLEREYHEDGETGFWSNRNIISEALDRGDLYVIRRDGEAVAYHVGHYAADISNVRRACRRKGFGTALLEASIARAYRDNVNVLDGECSPRDSLSFWQKHGFERYGDMSERGKVTVRRVLPRSFDLPSDLPRVPVTIGFYPEEATYYQATGIEPVAVHNVTGAHLDDGTVMLDRRVIGLPDDEPERKDLVVKVEVDGEVRCFCKAKYEEAGKAGVIHDWEGGCFYIDAIEPAEG